MLGNLMDPRGLAAVMPSELPGLPAVDPSSLAQSMGPLLPPGAPQAAPEPAASPAAIPGGNLMPPPPRPNLLPTAPDPTPNAPPMVPATAHEPPIDRKQAALYFINAANSIQGAFR